MASRPAGPTPLTLDDRVDLEPWVDFTEGRMRLAKTDPDGDFSFDYEDLDFARTGACPR